jgi:hypothetical protein
VTEWHNAAAVPSANVVARAVDFVLATYPETGEEAGDTFAMLIEKRDSKALIASARQDLREVYRRVARPDDTASSSWPIE